MFWLTWQILGVLIALSALVLGIIIVRKMYLTGAAITAFLLKRLNWIFMAVLFIALVFVLSNWK